MFTELTKKQDFADGIQLYKAFLGAIQAQDKARADRLAVRLNKYNNALPEPQKRQFTRVLVAEGLITGEWKAAIEMFDAGIQKIEAA
jgi:hypothetical protein